MLRVRARVGSWVAAAVLGAGELLAAEPSSTPGDTASALPGIARVGVPAVSTRRVTVAGTAGYGYTEAQSSADGAHHRGIGILAVGASPAEGLDLALRLDGRYDHHPDDGQGAHGTLVGDPRLLARYGVRAGESFRVGAEASLWVPGKDAPSVALDATSVDLAALVAWVPHGGPTLAALGGFRLDRSKNAAPDLARTRPGDRVALGLSGFNAALVGAGLSFPVGATEILAEITWDALVGSGAPLSASPLRATAGARHALSSALSLEARVEGALSGRPGIGPEDPLAPIEPRVSALVGLRYRFALGPEPEATQPSPEEAPAAKPSAAAAQPSSVTVRLALGDAASAKDAKVELKVGTWSAPPASTESGEFRFDGVPAGDGEITVEAEGFAPVKQAVHVEPGKNPVLEVPMQAVAPSGQLRGLVRSFAGKGLSASIRVEPIGKEATTDAEGTFTIDVPPGDYEVVLRANRYKEQKRKVHVDKNGVTVLNADLFEEKK